MTQQAHAFTFGEPEPMINQTNLFDYVECYFNGRYYEPPFKLQLLAKTFKSNAYLSSGVIFKRNFLSNLFIPHPKLHRNAIEQLALDYIWSGNAYLEKIESKLQSTIRYNPIPAKYMRCTKEQRYIMLHFDDVQQQEHTFKAGSVFHLKEADIDQEIYGVPEYISALQSVLLNESATLFRRKYYNNGSHAGFILYLSDPANDPQDINALRQALKDSKGPGNFRNLFFYSPNGKKDGIQVIPISEIAAKDDFASIKSITRDDILSALRIPPQLLGIVPSNAGGFGSIKDASIVFYENEIKPLQSRLLQINEWAGEEIIRFRPYELAIA